MIARLLKLAEVPRQRSDTLITAEHVSVVLGGRTVVRDVSLSIRRGEIVSLIGPNGSGKSSFVRALLGLVPLSSGRVVATPGTTIAYVPQRFVPDPVLPLTVARFLRMAGTPAGPSFDRVLDETGIRALIRRQLVELSGGELRRALIARALLRDPDLVVLDEPAQQIDFTGQLDLYRLIGRIRDQHGCGVLVVSHDLHVVMAATDRVLCFNGHVCCSGAPEAVSRHPEYIALFGARAAAGIAVYTHAHDHEHGPSGEIVPPIGHDHGNDASPGPRAKTAGHDQP
jgi:zinc transport system ATP-binding protein